VGARAAVQRTATELRAGDEGQAAELALGTWYQCRLHIMRDGSI
jgi:hypothetical protein